MIILSAGNVTDSALGAFLRRKGDVYISLDTLIEEGLLTEPGNVADTAIIPTQDDLGLWGTARINTPVKRKIKLR